MNLSIILGHRSGSLVVSVAIAAVVVAVASCAAGESGGTDDDGDGSRPATTAEHPARIAPPTPAASPEPASPEPASPAATVTPAAAAEILTAVDEIGLALRHCYQAAPGRCDSAELDAVLLPNALAIWQQRSDNAHSNGDVFENAAEWSWTVVGEPTAEADNVVLVTVCITDPIVHRGGDGTVIKDAVGSYREQWKLVWMARWKLAASTPIGGDVDC